MARFGYYADLRGLTFTENKSWIQAMRVGEYHHPSYGKINFTPDRLLRFADSVKSKVRGIALDIDYDHKTDPTKGNEAAGWVEDAKVEGDALFLLVDWTKSAVEKIKEKAYRYFSPEFQDEWTDSTGVQHRDVLFGGGITNRPYLKDLLPVNLSELAFERQLTEKKKEGNGMTEEQLKLLGLPKDATEEQINAKLQAVTTAATNPHGTTDHTGTTHAPNNAASDKQGRVDGKPFDATTAGAVDKDGNMVTPEEFQLSELAKSQPALAFMLGEQMKQNKALSEQIAGLQQSNKVNEIRVKLNEYRTGDKILAPALLDEAALLLAKAPTALHEDLHKLLKTVQGGTSTVQLGEVGHTNSGNRQTAGAKSAEEKVQEKVATMRKTFSEGGSQGNFSEADAMMDIFAADPELFKTYQEESYLFKA
jgi:hypothetical protein